MGSILSPSAPQMQATGSTQTAIPAWQQKALKRGVRAASGALATPTEELMGYDTASGQMLTANPYMAENVRLAQQPVVEQFQEAIAPTISSNFAQGGRFGSGLFRGAQERSQRELARQLAAQSSQMYGQQYGQERGLQQAAQARIDPLARAQQYMGAISGMPSQTTQTQMTPVAKADPWKNILGGAMKGGVMGAQAGGVGAIPGAGVGGLLGALG